MSGRGSTSTGVCSQCSPILSCYCDVFKSMIHTGTELKKRKRINPYPKRGDIVTSPHKMNGWDPTFLIALAIVCTALVASKTLWEHQTIGLPTNGPLSVISLKLPSFKLLNLRSRRSALEIMSSCLLTLRPLLRGGGRKLTLELLWKSGIPITARKFVCACLCERLCVCENAC